MGNGVSVYLIGGAPGVGKTTLGAALARRLGFTSLTVDDLVSAAQSVTTLQSHPKLHILRKLHYLEYYTNSDTNRLCADADIEHKAAWPIAASVIRKHVRNGAGIVIDGWHLRPDRVAALQAEISNIWAGWLIAEPNVLVERESNNRGWLEGSTNPDQMLDRFLARSLWFNEMIENEARSMGMHVFHQTGNKSADQLCDEVLAISPD